MSLIHKRRFDCGSSVAVRGLRAPSRDSEDERLVDNGLADVEDAYVVVREDAGEPGGEPGCIGPGEVNEDSLRYGSRWHSSSNISNVAMVSVAANRSRRFENLDRMPAGCGRL